MSYAATDPQTPRDPHAHTHNPSCAHCPMCGSQATHDVTRLVRGVYLANYTDGTHIWDTRWLAAA